MSSSLILDSTFTWVPRGSGHLRLRLVNAGRETFTGFRLGFTAIVPLTPPDGSPVPLLTRVGSYHEIVAPDGLVLEPGGVWEIGNFDCAYHLIHANDGPVRAFVIRADGTTLPVHVPATERGWPVRVGKHAPPAVVLADPGDVTSRAWAVAAGCERRVHPDDDLVLASSAEEQVDARIDEALGDGFTLTPGDRPGWTVTAGSPVALQSAFIELARQRRGETGLAGTRFAPRYGFRGLMLDLSRHFYPAVDVDEILDVAAWRKLNVLHLHLTDDQAWRVPIETYPAIAEVAAWRGHGLPIPPLHGSGADPYGGVYAPDEIRRWVAKAAELGIELIPEVDVPGHCYAPIVALPELLDPDDTGSAESVHFFRHNALNPGLSSTRPFLEAVFGEVAQLFPGSRIHIGCDEVAEGIWDGSPAAQKWAADSGLDGHTAMERAFVAEIVELVTRTTGRRIGAWQEAADLGGLQPGDGYVVGWIDDASTQRLAAAGYDVVSGAAQAYYLDMATGSDWHRPGHFWAGTVTRDAVARFDPTDGWDDAAKAQVMGVQAALWGEHVPDRRTLRALLLPRLDAFGDAAWKASP